MRGHCGVTSREPTNSAPPERGSPTTYKCGQREAWIGIAIAQCGQSFVVAAATGAGPHAVSMLLTSMNTENATIRKLTTALAKRPSFTVTAPAAFACSSDAYGPGVAPCFSTTTRLVMSDAAEQQADRRHEHVVHETLHDHAKDGPDDDPDGQIQHGGAPRKLARGF